jgi:hypothetical protein
VGAELFHADGQTDMTKLVVTFRTFANAPKNSVRFYPEQPHLTMRRYAQCLEHPNPTFWAILTRR